jgi:hypothetical protein
MQKHEEHVKENLALNSDLLDTDFLHLARQLRQIHQQGPELLAQAASHLGVSLRKVYALVGISRQFDDLDIPDERLFQIGWTKLQLLGRHLTDHNVEHLLQMAEENTVHDLKAILRGQTPVAGDRIVLLYLAPTDYGRLRIALLECGAAASGQGLANMEEAVMTLVQRAGF